MSSQSRRDFLKTAAMAIPLPLRQAMAAEKERRILNEWMIGRVLKAGVKDPVKFIFCADIHVPFDDRGVFQEIIKRANEIKPDFVLFGGDCVQVGNPANFSIFINQLKTLDVPVISAIGNHDTSFSDYADQREWSKRFGDGRFSFDVGGVRIIALNNANFGMDDAGYEFLENALKTDLQKIIAMHRPANFLNPLYGTPMRDEAGRFRELIEKAGVAAVLTGHEHHYGLYEINGVKHIVSGGAGGVLNRETENNFHHFLLIEASRGSFDHKVEKV